MKNKKGGSVVGGIIAVALIAILGIFVLFATGVLKFPTEQLVIQQTVSDIAEATQEGDVAQIKVYVRSISENNINTKVAVPVYCQDDRGSFIIDSTSSSTSTEITGTTTRGRTITCWAFDSTHQTHAPVVTLVDEEAEHILIDVYNISTSAEMTVRDANLNSCNDGAVNLSVGADGSDSFEKMKFKNNNTNKWLPLGGFFFNVIEDTNISGIDMSGSARLVGMDKASTQVVISDLSTAVTARKTAWDYVFEIDDDSAQEGNQALILEENDYLETGPITVTSAVGCTAGSTGAQMVIKAFTKGFYRTTKDAGVEYGHETDATIASVISADITGTTVYCA